MRNPRHPIVRTSFLLTILLAWLALPWRLNSAENPPEDFSQTDIYEVGQIPFQKVWHGDTLKFRVRSEALGVAATITATFVQPPTGEVRFSNGSEFAYRPGTGDLHEFTVTFRAQLGSQVIRQTIPITPLARLPLEQSFFGVERGPIPNPEDKQFLVFNEELSRQTNVFNYFTNRTRKVVIAGKTVVLQRGHVNGLHESLHESWNLQNLEIHAEKVIIASPLRTPGTKVTIRARELEFQDHGEHSFLSTEPRSLERAAPFADGAEGLPAGDMAVLLDEFLPAAFKAPPAPQPRFWLRGGNGQPGGTGQEGTAGPSKAAFSASSPYVRNLPSTVRSNITFVQYLGGFSFDYISPNGEVTSRYDWRPGNGTPAIPGGRPGSGGAGGSLTALGFPAKAWANVDGGDYEPGRLYSGGQPGQPVPAYYYNSTTGARLGSHTAIAGRDALPVPPLRTERANGRIWDGGGEPYSWLSPLALRQVIEHARSAYLNGQLEFVDETLTLYLQKLDDILSSHLIGLVDLPPGWDQDFSQMADEMRLLRHRIASNLDYFGNPPGWVPLLSFEANKLVFEQDIETSIGALYLEYWLGNVAKDLETRISGQEAARDLQKKALEQARTDYERATELLPEVQVQAGNMQVRIADLQEEIRVIEQDLQRRAQRNVEDRHKGKPWQRAAGVLGRICQVLPIYQPVLGAVGQGLVLASEYRKDDPMATLSKVPELAKQFTSENWQKSVAQTRETLRGLRIPDLDKGNIKAVVEDFRTKLEPWKEHYEKIREATRLPSAPKSEVEAELSKLKREHPELNTIIRKVEGLNADKEVLLLLVSTTIQDLGRLNAEIQFALLSMDALNQDISRGSFAFDDRAVSYLREMGRRARERLLRYHYNLKKAYEYRMLRPYTTTLDLDKLYFEPFKQLAESGKGARLDQADFQALAVLYREQLSQITSEVINWYNVNAPERSASSFVRLTQEQLGQLNTAGGVLTLNLQEVGLFPPFEENHRIVNIEVHQMQTSSQGNVGTGFLDLEIEHGGESVVSQGGRDYRFRHYNRSTEHPLVWGVRYTPSVNLREAVVPSSSAESMLRALLGPGAHPDSILLWSRPGGQADFHLRRQVYVPPPASGDIRIEGLELRITYDFYRRGSAVAVLEVVDESGVRPLVELSRVDQSGRQNGRGSFRRAYAPGGAVSLRFPIRQGNFKLSALRDALGNGLPFGEDGNTAELSVLLNQYSSVRARYEPVASGGRFASFAKPSPDDPIARFAVEGEHLAPYRVEFSPALGEGGWVGVTNLIFTRPEVHFAPAPTDRGFFRVVPDP